MAVFTWLLEPDHWRIFVGVVSMIGTGVNLWVGWKVWQLRNDYRLGVRLTEFLNSVATARELWGDFLSSASFNEKDVRESAAALKPKLRTLMDVGTPSIKAASKKLYSAITPRRNPLRLWLVFEPLSIDKDHVNNGWNCIVDLHEQLKDQQKERKARPAL
ncbi:MAG: hypothetical protein ACKVY0_29490 [Prosthecobacter sp.]|uniref:hypothetical protein n=1 Tax=Prosthecobacter sp. TaxID=1965333 RepID=UPI003900B253